MIQQFCDNEYIARLSYNDTSRFLFNYENKMPVKRLSAGSVSLFKSKLSKNIAESREIYLECLILLIKILIFGASISFLVSHP